MKKYVKGQHKQKYPDAIHSEDENFVLIERLSWPEVNSGQAMLLARQIVPFARRALVLNRGIGMGEIQSRARALIAAQFRWEDLQLGAPGHPEPALLAPLANVSAAPQVNVVPPAPQNAPPPRPNRGKRPRKCG